MNEKISRAIIYAAGVITGSIGTWFIAKKKFEKEANEEIASVREHFTKRAIEKNDISEDPVEDSYEDLIKDSGYISENTVKPEIEEMEDEEPPYVIEPEEFGEIEGYSEASLTYYADGVLTDDKDNPIDADIVGGLKMVEENMGTYENDALHIRNDSIQTDFEILQDLRKFNRTIKWGSNE